MALVDVESVKCVGENPTGFKSPFEFEITFECLEELEDDLEWRLVYVGSAGDESKDQTLEEVMVGPVPLGTSKFVLEAPAPSWDQIPEADRLGVTVLNVTCSYKSQPFMNVGYYVNNEVYLNGGPADGDKPELEPKPSADVHTVYRNVMADEPRVTRYTIKWTVPPSGENVATAQTGGQALGADDAQLADAGGAAGGGANDEPVDEYDDVADDDDDEEEEDEEDDDIVNKEIDLEDDEQDEEQDDEQDADHSQELGPPAKRTRTDDEEDAFQG